MNPNLPILELRNRLEGETSAWVLSALCQESLVREYLMDPLSGELAFEKLSSSPSDWTAARLSLLALGDPLPLSNLCDNDFVAFEPELHQKSEAALSGLLAGNWNPDTSRLLKLSEAGLVALALRELFVFHGGWNFLTSLISNHLLLSEEQKYDGIVFESARPVAACLVGMAPDPFDLLATLFQIDPGLGVNTFLCIPAPDPQKRTDFCQLLDRLPAPVRYLAFQILASHRPGLAEDIDFPGIANQQHCTSDRTGQVSWMDTSLVVEEAQGLLVEAQALTASQKPSAAIWRVQQAQDLTNRWHSRLQAKLNSLTALSYETLSDISEEDQKDYASASLQAWELTILTDPECLEYRAQYAWALLENDRIEEAQTIVKPWLVQSSDSLQTPGDANYYPIPFLIWGTAARLAAIQDQRDLCCHYLEQALKNLEAGAIPVKIIARKHLLTLTRLAIDYGFAEEAECFASKSLDDRPADPETLGLSAEAQLLLENPEKALAQASLAYGISPEIARQRLLIRCLEAAGEWTASLSEHYKVLARLESPQPEDYRLLGACALQAGQPELCIEACQRASEIDPQDGLAIELMGQVAQSEGNPQAALEHYLQAVQLSPNSTITWLSLAKCYDCLNNQQGSLETLRQASQALPGSAEIQLQLGEALIDEGSLTLALIPLRQAAVLIGLSPSNPTVSGTGLEKKRRLPSQTAALQNVIAWKLGNTLRLQGYLEESRQVFEASCQATVDYNQPATLKTFCPQFSHDYAQTLLALGDNLSALPWLELAIQDPTNLPAQLDFARVLLAVACEDKDPVNETGELQLAISILEQILETQTTCSDHDLQPSLLTPLNYAEAYALLAEALQRIGDLQRSLHAYRQAIQLSSVEYNRVTKHNRASEEQAAWRNRLCFGLGQVAMALGQHETAIAAFLEAIQVDSSNPILYRSLSEAYAAVELPADAYHTANQAVELDADNPETLVWYAEQCLRLYNQPTGKTLPAFESAQDSLEQATELAPERADLVVRLAEIHILRGDREAVLNILNRLVNNPMIESQEEVENDQGLEMVITLDDLQKAANLLRKTEQPAAAAVFLEQALNLAEVELSGNADQIRANLFNTLAQTYREAGELHSSLAAVDQAIVAIGASDLELKWSFLRHKSTILLALKNVPGALNCLLLACSLKPEAWDIHIQIALLQAGLGALPEALEEAETGIEILNHDGDTSTKLFLSRWIAAELAHFLIQEDRARTNLNFAQVQNTTLENACLQAELDLQNIDPHAAVSQASAALASVVEIAPHHPHLLALQARLVSRQDGVSNTCLQLLESALNWIEHSHKPGQYGSLHDATHLGEFAEPYYQEQIHWFAEIATLTGLVEAALDLQQWVPVEKITSLILNLVPASPAAYILQARALTRRAEMQRLCEKLLVIQHAPGAQSMSAQAKNDFEKALLKAAEQIDLDQGYAVKQVSHWRARGYAVFASDSEGSAALEAYAETAQLDPEDIAALIWAAGGAGNLEAVYNWNAKLPNHPLVSAVAAVILEGAEERERALHLVQKAIERQSNPDLSMPDAHPMLLSLAAQIGRRSAARPEEYQTALDAILAALELWPGEARWHDLAAMILLEGPPDTLGTESSRSDQEDPILVHLELAASLEPGLAEHHQKLGRYLALQGESELALAAFTQAAQAAPESAEVWLELAHIQRETGQLSEAIQSSERALAFANQSVEALLLRCELDLLTNNPRGALSRAQTILNIIPDHSDALYILAQALEVLNEPGEALIALEKGIAQLEDVFSEDTQRPTKDEHDQTGSNGWTQLLGMQRLRVRLIRRLNGSKTAIDIIQHLLATFPDDPVLSALLADYLLEVGQADKASQAARVALQAGAWELEPETQAHLNYLIGAHSRQTGQLDQAVYHLNQAIQKSPDFLEAYLELGRTHQDRRQNTLALESYQMAARRMPNDYRPYYFAGLALKEGKDYLGAETMFRRAAHLAPSEVSIHRQLAAVVALNLIHNRRVPASD